MKQMTLLLLLGAVLAGCRSKDTKRQEIDLNGRWEIARTGTGEEMPEKFASQVQVPGLVDLAVPSMDGEDGSYDNSLYWYRTNFSLDHRGKQIVRLKINKAKYHTRVYVNRQKAGEHVCNFTPGYFDLKPYLHPGGAENELVIAVGCKNNLPDTVTDGNDYEKIRYIPGIYDEVKLILSNPPYISRIQTAPQIDKECVRIVAEIEADGDRRTGETIRYVIRELDSGKEVARASGAEGESTGGNRIRYDFTEEIPGCRLWSPEDPFLYELEISTRSDRKKVRFGMRSFHFKKGGDVALLNGRPYYMRGTNVCIFRFFEDPARKYLPWDEQWVTKLHSRFKDMNWNSIRYCIGFPPERWYEIADSLGLMIQDEYPIWTGTDDFNELLPGVTPERLAGEYTEWMHERANHPCVVIWDAQNESVNETTGKAIQLVRHLDLSGRPWDNGWASPVSETDCIESHPYLFVRYLHQEESPSDQGVLKDLLSEVRLPGNDPNERSPAPNGKRYRNAVINNEYGWLWLNRDGTTTRLTDQVYQKVFPEVTTPEERFRVYARHLGMLTEYWRAHRKCAAVMHFCGLGYSRPDPPKGHTSDNFIDLENLVLEPHFVQYVKPAFDPVGLMIDFWDKNAESGSTLRVPVHVINDTHEACADSVNLYIEREGTVLKRLSAPCEIDALGKEIFEFDITVPSEKGRYRLVAELIRDTRPVRSIRDFAVR